MTPTTKTEDVIELHVPQAVRAIIEQAAHLSGRSMNDFMFANSLDAAVATIERIGRLSLTTHAPRHNANEREHSKE